MKVQTVLVAVCLHVVFAAERDCSKFDLDCNGKVSVDEIEQSSFFTSVDVNGDGTLGDAELGDLFDRLGVSDIIDVSRTDAVVSSVSSLDKDLEVGIQVADLMTHWKEKLLGLLTVEDVVDWISHAVELPQYADQFRENAVKGYDLASMLDGEGDKYLKEIGVHKALHTKQILRLIAIRLMGVAAVPSKPRLVVEEASDQATQLRWWMPVEDAPQVSLPLHKWRLYHRQSELDTWTLVEEYQSYLTTAAVDSEYTGEFRIEAWNAAGRSEYTYVLLEAFDNDNSLVVATKPICKPEPLSLVPPSNSCAVKKSSRDLFHLADHDGDGGIDSSELLKFLNFQDSSFQPQQITAAIDSVMSTLDSNDDKLLVKQDVEKHWNSLAFTMTVDTTAQWIAHAVNLPQYEQRFRDYKISGLDFAAIVASNGDEHLLQQLKIRDASHRSAIVRSMKIVLMAVGDIPRKPEVSVSVGDSCGSNLIEWVSSDVSISVIAVHKFVLYRRSGQGAWEMIYSGREVSYLDTELDDKQYEYKLVAWNLIGASEPSFASSVAVTSCANSLALQLSTSVLYTIYALLRFVMQNTLNVLVPVVAIYLAKNSKGVFKKFHKVAEKFPKMKILLSGMAQKFHVGSPRNKQSSELSEPPSRSIRARSLSEGHNEEARFIFKKSKSLSDDNASVNSNDSAVSTNSGRSKVMWNKLRRAVLRGRKGGKSKRKMLHTSSSFDTNSSREPENTDVTYRGGARNIVLYGKKELADQKYDLFDPESCMICRKSNLKYKHVCGKCNSVVCEQHTGKKSHGRWRECDIDSKCLCINCYK